MVIGNLDISQHLSETTKNNNHPIHLIILRLSILMTRGEIKSCAQLFHLPGYALDTVSKRK